MKYLLTLTYALFIFSISFGQRLGQDGKKVNITATIVDQATGEPMEYATMVVQNKSNPERVTGGLTGIDGKVSVEVSPGTYLIRFEYLSFKTLTLDNQVFRADTDLGKISMAADVQQLDDVVLVGERTTVELRLDKKIYNVGKDLTVSGGTVTDVLDNVPSVTVDIEGNISLRGNESVRILINGKPSSIAGLSPETLQQLPAEAIEKVEVITNPSARYDAQGTAGILNIILKQEKTAGINGSLNVYGGDPELYGGALSLNMRKSHFNLFTNTTYRYQESPGNGRFTQENFNSDGSTASFQDEQRDILRTGENFSTNIGFELIPDSKTSITNSFVFRRGPGTDFTDIDFQNFDSNGDPTLERERNTVQAETDRSIQYSLNFVRKFNDEGHELMFDYQYSTSFEQEDQIIEETVLGNPEPLPTEEQTSIEEEVFQLLQADYVLPFGEEKNSQFEAGYRGTFRDLTSDFVFGFQDEAGTVEPDPNFSNVLNYIENVNALYTQFGTKLGKVNFLSGLRMEASDITINSLSERSSDNKTYVDWFPSVFLGYEFSEEEQLTLSYSRRIRRPRGWFLNPFISRSSNTNLRRGNVDLDPEYSNAFDLGYLRRWDKVTISGSAYYFRSTGVFQFITQETGDFVVIDDPGNPGETVEVPVQIRFPINLATDSRYGGELTATYTPKRNWRLNWNLNVFQQQLRGDYTFVNFEDETITQNFDADNFTWFTRLTARFPLPGKLEFQTNMNYRGRRQDAQNLTKGIFSMNLAFSKNLWKDKGTISLNVSDLFNSRKRIQETRTTNVITDSEFQWRVRQVRLSFLYRFNQNDELSRQRRRGNGAGDGDGEQEFEQGRKP